MTLRRRPAVAAVTFGLCLMAVAHGQQPVMPPTFKEPPRTGDAVQKVREARDNRFQFNNKSALPAMQADMLKVARNLIYPCTDPKYVAPQDRITKDGLIPIDPTERISARIEELRPWVLVPAQGTKLGVNQLDYILYFGEATAAVFRELKLNDKDVPDYMRVNAGQMLAVCGRSGSPAMAIYVTELLTDPNTRLELLLYALQAAEGLLAAYNPLNVNSATLEHNHLPDKDILFNLVKAVQAAVIRDQPYVRATTRRPAAPVEPAKAPPAADAKAAPPNAADPKAPPTPPPAAAAKAPPAPPAGGQLEANPGPAMTPDQVAVFRYIRRAAVRALAQVRFPQVVAPNGETLRPLHTLAKFAVQDVSLAVPPGPDEAAEAVIGLCNLRRLKDREINPDVLFDSVAAGVAHFARPKTNDADSKALPWARYAGRLSGALKGLKGTLDATSSARAAAGKFDALAQQIDGSVLQPMFRLGAGGQANPDLQPLAQWRQQNKPAAGTALYPDVPATALTPADRRG